MGILYIVATPIGNLEDITLRALRVLKEADVVVCEDTRHSLKLLNHFDITKKLVSYHQHSRVQKLNEIVQLLREGKTLAVVSDAGTPAIADPGGMLVRSVQEELGDSTRVVPIPGASAVTALLSVAGLPADRFTFFGFIPHKKGKQKLLRSIAQSGYTAVFYESTHRIMKTLGLLADYIEPEQRVVVGRELTKQFESLYSGTVSEVISMLEKDSTRGEFVIAVQGKK